MSKLLQSINLGCNANGAISERNTGSAVLDFFSKSGAFRKADKSVIIEAFEAAFQEDPTLALKALFYSRDVRGGQGERNVFRVIVSYLANKNPEAIKPLLPLFAEYGRWDDLVELGLTPLEQDAFNILRNQFNADRENAAQFNAGISLVAKWLPSENASSTSTKLSAARFRKFCGMSSKDYRKALSRLRSVLNVVEKKLCAQEWDQINYEHVPSKASLNYRNAFVKHDPVRYAEFKNKVKNGEAKINTKTLFPYEVISKIFTSQMNKVGDSYYCSTQVLSAQEEDSLDLIWNKLPNFLGDSPEDGLVVVDTSGSMRGLPIQIAVSLGLYYAERNKGSFGGHFITFSEKPQLQKIEGKRIGDRVRNLAQTHWNSRTDLQAVFNLILDRAVKNHLKQEDLPTRVYIVSDMQFDIAVPRNTYTNLEVIKNNFKESGYKMPELVFWNVNAYAGNSPVKRDDQGVKIVSGASGEIFKQVVSSKTDNPYSLMLEILLSERYEPVTFYGK